jgi:hypothetical protein
MEYCPIETERKQRKKNGEEINRNKMKKLT